MGPGQHPLPIIPLQTHSFEAHLGAPSRLPGCLSCPAPPNSSQFIALKSTPLPSASAPTTAASAYGALRGPHRSSHEPSQPSTAGVTGTPLWVTLIFQGLCVKVLDCDPYSSRTTLRSGSAPPEPTTRHNQPFQVPSFHCRTLGAAGTKRKPESSSLPSPHGLGLSQGPLLMAPPLT